MSQNPLFLPTQGTLSGTQLVTLLNQSLDTLLTLNAGASQPSSPAEAYMLWMDTSTTPPTLRIHDGTAWRGVGRLDVAAGVYSPNGLTVGAGGMVSVGTAAAQPQTGAAETASIPGNGLMVNDGTIKGLFGAFAGSELLWGTYSNHAIDIRLNNARKAGWLTNGALMIGADTSAPNNEQLRVRGNNATEGNAISTFANSNGFAIAYINNASGNGWNGAATCLNIGSNSSTSRSLNASGTLNASGADVAEYKHKASGCGALAAGQVCGLDGSGRITDKWADAVQFRWKSGARGVQPALVMGDAWGAPDAICPVDGQPLGARPKRGDHESDAEHEAVAAAFEARYEACRAQVDRLVYCGTAYFDLAGLVGTAPQPGDFIVPVQNGAGIGWMAVSESAITFDDYKRRIGRVERLEPDGTPLVAASF
jgi:hypothetical protein